MQVSTITMDPEDAQAKLQAYRRALAGRHSQQVEKEYDAAESAYNELAKGTPLLDPFAAIRSAGWRSDSSPVLAIARADQRVVAWDATKTAQRWNSKTNTYNGSWSPMTWRFRARRKRFDQGRAANLTFEIDGITEQPPGNPKSGAAMVPMVPPDVLPVRGCDLSKHFILWEVENWSAAPPTDPILLKLIAGNLYAVVAQWDLTEVERLIIAGTRSNL